MESKKRTASQADLQLEQDRQDLLCKRFMLNLTHGIKMMKGELRLYKDALADLEQKHFEEGVHYNRLDQLADYYLRVIDAVVGKIEAYNRSRLCMRKSANMAGLAILELHDLVDRIQTETQFDDGHSLFPEMANKQGIAEQQATRMYRGLASQVAAMLVHWRELVDPFKINSLPDPMIDSEDDVIFCDDDGNEIPDEEAGVIDLTED